MKVLFIRHGKTNGNIYKKYIGRTDELLCQEGIEELEKLSFQRCEIVVCSPMKRCLQTALLLFPAQPIIEYSDLRECDFGDFEGKNYVELSDNADYEKWVESGGLMPFPGGDDPSDFRKRCVSAYEMIINQHKSCDSIAFVVHGGTIMSIMEKYALPHKEYYDWHCENGHGYICEWDGLHLQIMEEI